jgi:hypothetical protein
MRFIDSEAGAVTVDWVVLTAATVGLGLAAMGVVTAGIRDLSGDIDATIASAGIEQRFGAIGRAVVGVTDAMTGGTAYAAGDAVSILRNAERFSLSLDVDLRADQEGILFEAGGDQDGTILYQHDGTLYLQAGAGGGDGTAPGRAEVAWAVEDGAQRVEASLDASSGIVLYVDGRQVGQADLDATLLAGGSWGAVGDGHTSVAANKGGFGVGDVHAGVSGGTVFAGQTIGSEAGG